MEGDSAEREPDHECPICKDELNDPVQVAACRHTFCRACLTRSLKSMPHCPMCRGDINGDIVPAVLGDTGGAREQVRRRVTAPRTQPFDIPEPLLSRNPTTERFLQPDRSQRVPPNATPAGAGQVILGAVGFAAALPPGPVFSQLLMPPSPSFADEQDLSEILEMVQCPVSSSQNSQSSSVMVFSCPYCQEGGLDELNLLDHCNNHHQYDQRPVVCPVCAALPYGDPSYCSRNFIGHLNLRHNFYKEDFMDVQQSDAMNEQAALWESLTNAR